MIKNNSTRNIIGTTQLRIAVKETNNNEIVLNGSNGGKKKLTSRKSVVHIPMNLMEHEELHEKHLQDAIKYRSAIPIPNVVKIKKQDYDLLYPKKFKKYPRIRMLNHRKFL